MKKILSVLKKPETVRLLLAVFSVLTVAGLVFFVYLTKNRLSIENSLVSAPITAYSPSISGKLKNILVSDGQKVTKGTALATVGSETIRAYTDGVVIETNKQIGALVNPQITIVKVINPNNLRINGTIDENKGLNQIKIGQVASFTVDALPGKTFWGYVDEVAQSARQTQVTFSISSERPTQQFDIYVRFDASKYPEIKNGMSAKMTVYTITP